jgi:uncharacterized surface protein with fasciclin (FAS1) repeats
MKSKCGSWSMMVAPFMVYGMAKIMKNMMDTSCSSEAAQTDRSCRSMDLWGKGEKDSTDPWSAFEAPAAEATAMANGPKENIIEIASTAGSFNTLVAAVQAADLVETLEGQGPFTVFAPTDEAFSALPEGTLEDLLKLENKEKLQAILTYHVVPGRLQAADLIRQQSAVTVNGQELAVGLKVNQATVTQADISASNGVIHVIDTVLLPE